MNANQGDLASEAAAVAVGAAAADEPDERERRLVLWVTNLSHAANHFQNQMVSVMYPVILAELGMSYTQLGVLTAARSLLGNATQVGYGFLTPFVGRAKLLGIGNVVLGIGTLLSGLTTGFGTFLGARSVSAIGSSAQHPVGSSMLAGYFPTRKGTILALNSSIANLGSLAAPLAAGFLVIAVGWRQTFFIVSFASLAMGAVYFLFRDRIGASVGSRTERARRGLSSYVRVLRNRNIMVVSLVMMVGAAGTEAGVDVTYLGPHFVNDLGLSLAFASLLLTMLQVGHIVGPVGFGWLSDRFSRKNVLQVSLALSAIGSFWVARQDAFVPALLTSILAYGSVTGSRNTLTQALVADSLADEDRDAAFSVYYFIAFFAAPFWGLATGYLMETFGFTFAYSRLSISYVLGMALLVFLDERRSRAAA